MSFSLPFKSVIHDHQDLVRRLFVGSLVVQVFSLTVSIALSSIAFGAAVILFAILAGSGLISVRRNGLEWYLALYALGVGLMVVFAIHPAEALYQSRHLLLLSMVFFVPAVFKSEKAVRYFLLALAVIAAFQSMIEIAVFFLRRGDRLGYFQHYMTAAGIKMIVLLMAAPLLLHRQTSRRDRLVLGIVLTIILYALVMTQTRSSWAGFTAGMIMIGILRFRWALAGLAVIALLFALFATGPLRERVAHMFSTEQPGSYTSTVASNQYRLRMWRTGWQMFLDHPLTGVGDGDVWWIYRTYVPEAHPDEGGHLHNSYIHTLATHGAIGFLGFIALLASIVRFEWGVFRMAGDSFWGVVVLGSFAAFCGVLVSALAEHSLGDHEILVLLWTSVGLSIVARHALASTSANAHIETIS